MHRGVKQQNDLRCSVRMTSPCHGCLGLVQYGCLESETYSDRDIVPGTVKSMTTGSLNCISAKATIRVTERAEIKMAKRSVVK